MGDCDPPPPSSTLNTSLFTSHRLLPSTRLDTALAASSDMVRLRAPPRGNSTEPVTLRGEWEGEGKPPPPAPRVPASGEAEEVVRGVVVLKGAKKGGGALVLSAKEDREDRASSMAWDTRA